MENSESKKGRTLSIAFIVVLVAVALFTVIGMIAMRHQPLVLQGQAEATEIRISGKLPGRIDTFLVEEGQWVKQGDTLVVINSPTVEAKYRQVDALKQVAVEQNKKIDHLLYLLDADVYQRVMIFCNTKFMTDRLTERLKKEGYQAECIHGDVKQSQRNVVMNDFRRGKFPILIATDVAARGIDVDDVEAVINFDLPAENEYYLHRIGRTGRAHKHGVSFSLVTFQESVRMDEILKYMIAKPLPLHFEDGILRNEDGTPFFDNI